MADMDDMRHGFSILPNIILAKIIGLATRDDSQIQKDKFDRKLRPNKLLLPLMGACRSLRAASAQLFYHYAYMHFGLKRPDEKDKLPIVLDVKNILLAGCLHNVRHLVVCCGPSNEVDQKLLDALPEILKPGRLTKVMELRFILLGFVDQAQLVPKSLCVEYDSLFRILTTCAPDVRHIGISWNQTGKGLVFSSRYERERQHRYALIEHESRPFLSGSFDAMSHMSVMENVVKLVRQRAPDIQSLSVRSDEMVCLQHLLDRIGEDYLVFPKVIELDTYSVPRPGQGQAYIEHNMFPALLHFHAARRFPFCDGTGLLNNPSGLESLVLKVDAKMLQKLDELDVFRKDMYRNLRSINVSWLTGCIVTPADQSPGLFKKVVEMSPNPQRIFYCVSGDLALTSAIDVLASKQLVDLRCVVTKFTWIEIFKICTRVTSLRHVSFALELINDTISDFVNPYMGSIRNMSSVRSIELLKLPTGARMQTAVANAICLAAMLPTVERIIMPMGSVEYMQDLSDSLADVLTQPEFSGYTRLQRVIFDINANESYN